MTENINIKPLEPDIRANGLKSAFPTHPGSRIKMEIEARGISQNRFAEILGVSTSGINEVLNGRRSLTEKMALMIEAVLGIEAEPLLQLQLDYNLRQTRNDNAFTGKLRYLRQFAVVL